MPSSFAADLQDASPDFDEAFGELFTVLPQVEDDSSEYVARGADPSHAERQIIGIISDAPVISTVLGSGANTHDNADAAVYRTTIDFDLRLFADPASQPAPAEGWVIRADEQPGRPLYEVTVAQSDKVSRMVCKVVYKGLSPA